MHVSKSLLFVAALAAVVILSGRAFAGDDDQPAPGAAPGGVTGRVIIINGEGDGGGFKIIPGGKEISKPDMAAFMATAKIDGLIQQIAMLNMRPDFTLTADQKQKIADVKADWDKALKADKTTKPDDYLAKINAVLTPEQQKIKAAADAKAAADEANEEKEGLERR